MSYEQLTSSGTEAARAAASLAVELGAPSEGRRGTLLELLSVVGFFALCLLLLLRIHQVMTVPALRLVGWALAGYVAADFFSGLVHWAFDTWGSASTPVVGRTFIIPFRIHHDDPKDITRHGFIPTNGHTCLPTLPLLAATLLLPADWSGTASVTSFLLTLCMGTMGTNQFHKWAHQDTVPALVGWMQRKHLVLSPAHHDVHHQAPHERHYCITTGWLNALLDGLGFFRGAERLISRFLGATPRRDDLANKVP